MGPVMIRAFSRAGTLAAGLVALAAVAQPAPGSAQAPPAGPATPPAEQQPAEVSDQKLRQFVTAAAGVQKIQQEYAAKAQTLQKTTEDKIVSSVEQAGMTVEEFTALVARVQSDPDFARRVDGLQSQ
jgi:hypothetical protein